MSEEVRPSSGQTHDLAFFVDTQGFTAEIARQHTQGLHAIGLGPDEGFKSSGDARGRIGKADDDSLIIDRCGRVPDIAADVAKINRDTVLPKHRVCHFLPSAGFVANGSVLLGLPPPWSM